MEKIMAQKKKTKAMVVSQEKLADGIYDLRLETELAQDAACGQFVGVYPKDKSTLLPRPISICEIDKEKNQLRLVYRVAGKGTAEFSNLKTGDSVYLLGVLGNGFPVAGLLIHDSIEARKGMLGTTFGGNHLACAAAIAVLDVIEQEALVENAAQVGAYLMEELKKFPQIKEVRGRGLMIGLEFEEPVKELRLRLLKEQHVFTGVSGTNVLRLLPPLCLGMDEANLFLERFKKAL